MENCFVHKTFVSSFSLCMLWNKNFYFPTFPIHMHLITILFCCHFQIISINQSEIGIWEPIIKPNLKTIWKRSWEIEEIILFSSLNNNFSSFLFELNKYFIKYYFIYFSRYLSAWNDFVAIDSDLAPPTELDPLTSRRVFSFPNLQYALYTVYSW